VTEAPFVFAYPEEAALAGPDALVAHVEELGFGGIAVALAYHRARRLFPRYGRVSVSPPGHLAFAPDPARYDALTPACTADAATVRAVQRLRVACDERGLRFHAWLVALHHEGLVAALPEAGAQTADGTPTGFSLCPAQPAAVAYCAALVEDVCAQFAPDAIELEAATFPAWEPAYTLTLALDPLPPRTQRLAAQCFCDACRAGLEAAGEDPEELARAVRGAAGLGRGAEVTAPFGHLVDDLLANRLAAGRTGLLAPLVAAVAERAQAAGARVRLAAFGEPETIALQGVGPASLAPADGVLLGLGAASGPVALARFAALRTLAGDLPAVASLNWAPDRGPAELAADVRALDAAGAEHALPAFAAAARAASPNEVR
jgi:hypothetical protein